MDEAAQESKFFVEPKVWDVSSGTLFHGANERCAAIKLFAHAVQDSSDDAEVASDSTRETTRELPQQHPRMALRAGRAQGGTVHSSQSSCPATLAVVDQGQGNEPDSPASRRTARVCVQAAWDKRENKGQST